MKLTTNTGAFGALSEPFCQYDTAAIAILPVPYDGTSTWMKGADRGPQAILEASAHMELYDIETDSEVFRHGIATLEPLACSEDPEGMVAAVYERANTILRDEKFLVGLGGEHTISIGFVRAAAERFQELSVLQLDAHADMRDAYKGSRYNHACVMSRIREICPYVQAGVRSMEASEAKSLDRSRVLFAREMLEDPGAPAKVLKGLTGDVYITIDLDVLDPAYMPSTGTPEPGGLDWHALVRFVALVVKEANVIGMDVAELLPNPGNRAPDFLAAKLVYHVVSMIFAKKIGDS
jgi:agmatinase